MNKAFSMAKKAKELQKRAVQNPLAYFRPTPPQKQFLSDGSNVKLLLGGNQTGKSACAIACLLYRCLGIHPYLKTEPPPIEAWLVTASWEQSRTLQAKLWEMLPKHELTPDVEFRQGKGFRGLAPVVTFRNGSIIRIKTAAQGLGLASATCALVVIDEPVEASTFNELLARTLRGSKGTRSGVLAVTMTPIGADVQYMREMVAKEQMSCTRAPLTVKDTTPEDCLPLLSQKQIDTIASKYLPIDREARLNGSWDIGVINGRIFENFDQNMISSAPVPAGGDYLFFIGIDHGTQPNSQVAILGACDVRNPGEPRVYVLDEYVSATTAPPEAHARAILEMLKRSGIDPAICRWTGDSAHSGTRNRQVKRMSNLILMRSFEKITGSPERGLPWRINTAVKYRHSVYYGASVLHSIMSRRHFWVHPRCQRLIMSLQRWTMKDTQSARSKDPMGHCIDALRYGVLPHLDNRYKSIPSIRVV
jgi:hypothetical protein